MKFLLYAYPVFNEFLVFPFSSLINLTNKKEQFVLFEDIFLSKDTKSNLSVKRQFYIKNTYLSEIIINI